MKAVDLLEAQKQLLQLALQAAGGQDVVISRDGKPVARITRLEPGRRRIRFGALKGRVGLADTFDAPLPDDVAAGFEHD